MDPGKIFQIITNSTLLATRLLSGPGGAAGPMEFSELRYCALLDEDAQMGSLVVTVSAAHKQGQAVRYSITGGNKDGLFTIDQHTGVITLAAALDYEVHDKHELVVAAEVHGETVHAIVQVRVRDVNDNPPVFLQPAPQLTVIEEDDRHLPATLVTVTAGDKDRLDQRGGLVYTLKGDGVDAFDPADAYFAINPRTGELVQLRALDRDPPRGRRVWRVRVLVRDGQAQRSSQEDDDDDDDDDDDEDDHLPLPPLLPHTRRQRKSTLGRASGDVDTRRDEEGRRRDDTSRDQATRGASNETDAVEGLIVDDGRGRRMEDDEGRHDGTQEMKEKMRKKRRRRRRRNSSQQTVRRYVKTTSLYGRLSHPRGLQAVGLSKGGRRAGAAPPSGRLTAPGKLNYLRQRGDSLPGSRSRRKASSPPGSDDRRRGRAERGSGRPVDDEAGDSRHWFSPTPDGDLQANQHHTNHLRHGTSKQTEMSGEDQPADPRDQSADLADHTTDRRDHPGNDSTYGEDQPAGSRERPAGPRERPADPTERTGNHIQSSSAQTERVVTSPAPHQRGDTDDIVLEDNENSRTTSPSGSRLTTLTLEPGHVSLLDLASDDVTSPHDVPTPKTIMPSESIKDEDRNIDGNLDRRITKSPSVKPALSGDDGDYTRRNTRLFPPSAERDSTGLTHDQTLTSDQHDQAMGQRETTTEPPVRSQRRVTRPQALHDESGLRPGTSRHGSGIQKSTLGDTSLINVVNESSPSVAVGSPHDSASSRGARAATTLLDDHYDLENLRDSGECENLSVFGGELRNRNRTTGGGEDDDDDGGGPLKSRRGGRGRVHVVETVVTVLVKDINDNPPVFPNATMYGEVQENGPIDLSVAVVSAWDADDASEGTNARLTYSIEKNVIHDRTGEAIFTVDPQSGLILTALCCLDRETTPEYHIQVVASDGGGLKGTGTVVIRLADVNDNSPRLARQLWELEVDETWGEGPPDNSTILEISAVDRDTSNYFFYRVVEESGWGWQHFGVRSVGAVGQLFVTRTLDFEDETHRRGFRFMVQVTDRGRGGWTDPRHLATAWVSVRLRDVNDNPPQFRRPHAHLTVREDAAPGTLLAALPAHDPDMGGAQEVEYRVTGGWGALTVDAGGGVSLWRGLDREAPDGAVGVARVIGVDRGAPPLTATATLTITVTDVNDCAPRLLPPTLLHVAEGGAAPTLLGLLTATDRDVWALGHGPPFTLALAPTNPAHVLAHISLSFDPHLDSGRGGAELWTLASLDREEVRELAVGVLVSDAGGVSAVHTVSVVVDDLNDNPMRPAAKAVYLWKTQGGGSDAPLGRVYVDDPDDWDLGDKTFRWRGAPHPLFSLHPDDGTIYASSQVRQGRYELQFSVSDALWDQRDVAANVTVTVRVLSPDALAHATPITLTPTTPTDLTRGWTPEEGGGGLGRLLEAVEGVVGREGHTVEVVSVYGRHHPSPHPNTPTPDSTTNPSPPTTTSGYTSPPPHHHQDTTTSTTTPATTSTDGRTSLPHRRISAPGTSDSSPSGTTLAAAALKAPGPEGLPPKDAPPPSACVWVSVREDPGGFMDPVKLQGLLALHSQQLEETTHLQVLLEEEEEEPPAAAEQPQHQHHHHHHQHHRHQQFSAATRASTALPLQVVDTNVTSLVTPRLSRTHACHAHEPESCTPTSCLNGGRCLGSGQANRCVCPAGSTGPLCKVLGRAFFGSGWAWVRPLPSCLPTTVSVRLLTRQRDALILYSGPLAARPRHHHVSPTPMLALQLRQGRPQALLEGAGGPLKLAVNATLNDGDWHTIHLQIKAQVVSLMVDFCGRGWEDRPPDDSHCVARAAWTTTPRGAEAWVGTPPLQVGGLAHTPPRPEDHGWREAPIPRPLDGCISHLTFNGQLVDLGEPAYSRGSAAGCRSQEAACPGGCGRRGRCVGGQVHPECDCDPGWAGPVCDAPTVPVALRASSYIKVALSIRPTTPQAVRAQLRVRTRGPRHGLLLRLATHQQHTSAFTLYLRGGVACASVSWAGRAARTACVEGRPLGDGAWHTVRAERHGRSLVVSVDDGDDWRRNESLAAPGDDGMVVQPPPPPPAALEIDQNDGATVGGLPEYVDVRLVGVLEDLNNSCIDDLRVSGRPLPLPPAVNGTSWGQVTTWKGLESGCTAPDACLNTTTCAPPLSCVSTWGQATCRCGVGRQLVDAICEDVDECQWRPCLHGGSCHNLRPGFQCVCGPGHTGQHCQWTDLRTEGHPLTAPVAIAALTVSLLLLVVVGILVSLKLRRLWFTQGGEAGQQGGEGGTVMELKGSADQGNAGDIHRKTLLECLRFQLPPIHPVPLKRGKKVAGGQGSSHADSILVSTNILVAKLAPVGVSVPLSVGGPAGARGPIPLPAKDDLRAYAYEGDGSSAGSLTSAISGLREEQPDEGTIKPLVPEFLEVMDLLRNLPEASRSPTLLGKFDDQVAKKARGGESSPAGRVRHRDVTPLCTRRICAFVSRAISSPPANARPAPSASPGHDSPPHSEQEQMTVC